MNFNKIESLVAFIKDIFYPNYLLSNENNEIISSTLEEIHKSTDLLVQAMNDPLLVNHENNELTSLLNYIRSLAQRLEFNSHQFANIKLAKSIVRKINGILSNNEHVESDLKDYSEFLDQQTGQHGKYLERLKSDAIKEIRSETSLLKEQLQDEARQLYDKENNDLRSSFNSYKNEIRLESASVARDLHADFKTKLADLDNKFEATVGERIEHFEKRFSLLQMRNTELTTSMVNIESSISQAVQDSKDVILKDVYLLQDEAHLLRKEISNASTQLTKDLELVGRQAKETLLKSVNDEIAQYKKVKELLSDQVKNATEIVGTLSKKAMAHEHITQANREFKTFLVHQILGVVFLLGAVAMSIAIFSNSLGINVPWLSWLVSVPTQTAIDPATGKIIVETSLLAPEEAGSLWFFKRISILVLLTAPGIYFLKEAAVHRSKENVYRQRGVQLAAIAPYLNELEPCERQGIKKDLVKTFFSFHDGKADTQNVPDFLRDLKETMKIVRSIDKLDPHNRVRKVKRSTEES